MKKIYTLLLILLLQSCSNEKVPAGQIMVKNDTQDKEYNVIYVSASGVGAYLKPGENVVLPRTSTRFTVSREYRDRTRSYTVECPPISGKGVKIRMIDIHVNRIAGDCKTVNAS